MTAAHSLDVYKLSVIDKDFVRRVQNVTSSRTFGKKEFLLKIYT